MTRPLSDIIIKEFKKAAIISSIVLCGIIILLASVYVITTR